MPQSARIVHRLAAAMRRGMALLAISLVVGVGGCSSDVHYRVLSFLFDEVPESGEDAAPVAVVRRPRHPPPPTPPPTPTPVQTASQGIIGIGSATVGRWEDVERLLPRDVAGNPDWVGALVRGMIAPRPGLEPTAEELPALALDVELVPKSDPALKVVFSHERHTGWLTCSNCHPSLFEMKAGATPMAPEDAHADKRCGACHGKVAFDVATGCSACHLRSLPADSNGRVNWSQALADKLIAPRPGRNEHSADQPTLELDVRMKSDKQPEFDAVFKHAVHTQWLACANCHPRLFPMQTTQTAGIDMHARDACGACHGSVSFGLIGGCDRCHAAFEKEKHHRASLDLDVEVASRNGRSTAIIFSHKLHTPWVECANCHTDLYEPNPATARVSTKDLQTGRYCAGCHGQVASDLIARCRPCHANEDDL